MIKQVPDPGSVDEVQIFDAGEVLEAPDFHLAGQAGVVEMATSPNCDITVLRTPPRGETRVEPERSCDQILLVLKGECILQGVSGQYDMKTHQGVLIPGGFSCGITNTTNEELIFLSLRSESAEGRPGYVPNGPSGVLIKVPEAEISAKGLGKHVYVYSADERTLRIAAFSTLEWARSSLTRLYCEYQRSSDHILVDLPERVARWYQVRDLTESDYHVIPDPDRTSVRVDLSPLIEREASHR